MKILHIIPNLSGGGAERFVVDLVNEISKEHEVHLCTLFNLVRGKNDFFFSEISENVFVHSLNKKVGIDFKLLFDLLKLLNDLEPDVVHTHLSSVNYILPFKPIYNRTLFVHTVHNDAFKEVKNNIELQTRKFFYKNSWIHPVTISVSGGDSFETAYGLPSSITILNGRKKELTTKLLRSVERELSTYKKTTNTILLVNVGMLKHQKNQILLAKAVDSLINEGFDLALLFIGGEFGTESIKIKGEIEALRNERIHFLGSRRNIIDYLSLADAFCLSSSYEGMPISLIEAMAVGCIPICTSVGGIPDMIKDGESGFLAVDLTEKSFKVTLKRFINFPEKNTIKEKLKEEFQKHYEISSTAKKYLEFYENAKI